MRCFYFTCTPYVNNVESHIVHALRLLFYFKLAWRWLHEQPKHVATHQIKVVVSHYCGILLCIDINKYLYILLLCHTTGWPPLNSIVRCIMLLFVIKHETPTNCNMKLINIAVSYRKAATQCYISGLCWGTQLLQEMADAV